MFYFQLPWLPELMMKANDFAMLAATFRGKKGGVKNRKNFTGEDLNVFKHYLDSWGMFQLHAWYYGSTF